MKTLNKALNILELFLINQDEISLSEIARYSDLNKTTVYKILSTFSERGYLYQREKRGKYSLGTIFMEFSNFIKSRNTMRNIALPYLEKLARDSEETVVLAIGNGKEGLFSETFNEASRNNNVLRVVPQGKIMNLMHCTATGKIFLANLGDTDLQRYLDTEVLKQFTPNTITNPEILKKHILNIRQRGIAYDNEELTLGVIGIGTGLKDRQGNIVGAISVLAPSVRLTKEKRPALESLIKNCAASISREVGYRKW